MKILGIFVFIFILSITFSLLIDILLGFSLSQALLSLRNPFWVIETGEYVMIAGFLVLTVTIHFLLKLKDMENDSK
ncbi:hypothetical protein [Alteribacillus sp. HJP-4]|uniref:hypothetical protein n=1 Tax=Alteribacillus sp. HJP-4 TaxID=2775394 RepID=UPI0035CD3760